LNFYKQVFSGAKIRIKKVNENAMASKMAVAFYEHPQSESQPGFPFLNFLEEKFFLMILNR